LVDRYTNTTQRMSNVDSTYYNFDVTLDPNSVANRFYIILAKPVSNPSGPILTAETQVKPVVLNTFIAEDKSNISVFPNPIQNKKIALHFQQAVPGQYVMKLYNMAGQMVKQSNFTLQYKTFHFSVDAKNISSGAYKLTLSKGANLQYSTSVYIP